MSKFDLSKSCNGKRPRLDYETPILKTPPKVRELMLNPTAGTDSEQGGASFPLTPPATVLTKLRKPNLVIGIDLETNDFEKRNNPRKIGQFGHPCRLHPNDLKQRIVQIGYAVGGVQENDPLQERGSLLVRPDGFSISPKAIKHHGITNERALETGVDLRYALEGFLGCVRKVVELGGCIVAHNLEFDAGIIENELNNAGLAHLCDDWACIAKAGVCTMDEDIMKWAIACHGGSTERPNTQNALNFMGLQNAVKHFLPNSPNVRDLLDMKGDAGADAQMHRLLYNKYRAYAENAMRFARLQDDGQ
jgi:DNA polymerase III epsilon subunit-like protein